jgi:hypothetical protein
VIYERDVASGATGILSASPSDTPGEDGRMKIDDVLDDDDDTREAALKEAASLTAAARTQWATSLAARAKDLASKLSDAEEEGDDTDELEERVERAATALVRVTDPVAAAGLAELAAHPSTAVRQKVVLATYNVRDDVTRSILERLVQDPEADVRNDAADAVRDEPWAGAVDALFAALAIGNVPTEQVSGALAAAAKLSTKEVQARVAETLLALARSAPSRASSMDKHRCMRALDALVWFGGKFPGVRDAAPSFASSNDVRTRVAGIALLAAGGDADAMENLRELARKGTADEAASANVHLRRIAG